MHLYHHTVYMNIQLPCISNTWGDDTASDYKVDIAIPLDSIGYLFNIVDETVSLSLKPLLTLTRVLFVVLPNRLTIDTVVPSQLLQRLASFTIRATNAHTYNIAPYTITQTLYIYV